MFSCFLHDMAKNEKQEWITTKIPKDIADEIEILIKNKKLGYNSKTGFVSDALREKIDQLSGKSKKQQTKLEDKMNNMEDKLIDVQQMLIDALEYKREHQLKELEAKLGPKDKTVMQLKKNDKEIKKKIINNKKLAKKVKKMNKILVNDGHMTYEEMLKKASSPEYKKQWKIEQEQKIKDIKEIAGSNYVPYGDVSDTKLIKEIKESEKLKKQIPKTT